MDWFKMIKGFYPKFWTKDMVADAVVCEKITKDEYAQITGEPYQV
ncbi:XkdX family protein [Gracilibacillus xinjiangensis]|uniref:XkdX family protein n=1 Tax=Gracilibacillus xinjiangensis TaxID=1193282 RepID=A0ABV8WWM0_9BACI